MELAIAYYGRCFNDDESMTSSKNGNYMLRGSKENEHPYYESDALKILDGLLEEGIIELP